jgi:hypothetical protein
MMPTYQVRQMGELPQPGAMAHDELASLRRYRSPIFEGRLDWTYWVSPGRSARPAERSNLTDKIVALYKT